MTDASRNLEDAIHEILFSDERMEEKRLLYEYQRLEMSTSLYVAGKLGVVPLNDGGEEALFEEMKRQLLKISEIRKEFPNFLASFINDPIPRD